MNSNEIMYLIATEDVQMEAERYIGRRLTEEELYTAQKCIDWGLSTGLDVVIHTSIEEAVHLNTKEYGSIP